MVTRGRRLRRRCFATDGVPGSSCPSFGAFTGGLNVRTPAFAKVFEGKKFTAWMIGRDRIYPVPAKRLVATD